MYDKLDKVDKLRNRRFLLLSLLIHVMLIGGILLFDGVDVSNIIAFMVDSEEVLPQP